MTGCGRRATAAGGVSGPIWLEIHLDVDHFTLTLPPDRQPGAIEYREHRGVAREDVGNEAPDAVAPSNGGKNAE